MNSFFRYASIACLSLTLASAAQAVQTFSITQGIPAIQHVDLGKPGASHGDLLAFEAPFTTKDGKKGSMSGLITTVSLPTGADRFIGARGQMSSTRNSTGTYQHVIKLID